AQGRIFDLGRIDSVQGVDYADDEVDFRPGDKITYIEIYYNPASYQQIPDPTAPLANFYIDPLNESEEFVVQTRVRKIESEYYTDTDSFWVLFEQPYGGASAELGIFMIVTRGGQWPQPGRVDTIGTVTPPEGEPYRLKLLKESQESPTQITWNYMWRNVYDLQQRNIDLDGFEINVFKGEAKTENSGDNLDHQGGIQYIRILGLDRINQNGAPQPDGLVDLKTDIIDPIRGLLIFPDRYPFNPSQSWVDTVLDPKVPELYNSASLQGAIEASKYYIEINNRSRAAEISLGKPNIIEGSERITINGQPQVKGTDYNINYDFGQLTFLTDDALDPNANVSIDFEYAPFIAAEKKTLFGVRTEYEASRNLRFGSTFLYKSDKATPRKPKIGQETARTIVWDVDGSFKLKPNFLTKMADALPLISTETPSNLAVSGEFAQSLPNPNVDGVAYVDDFEGSRDAYSLGVFRELWTYSSKPVGVDPTRRRSRLVWYNPWKQVATDQIWERDLAAGESGTHTLWIEFSPDSLDLRIEDVDEDTTSFDPRWAWAGIMRPLMSGARNQERAQLLELRLNGDKGIIHIDLGKITEDVNGNDELNTEDRNRNEIIDMGEDYGLDGIPDEYEIDADGQPYDPSSNPDPHGDNWYYNGYGKGCNGCDENDYTHINGTEGNSDDPNRWGKPDTEDIDYSSKDAAIDRVDSYFSYKIDLEDDRFLVEGSRNNYGWRTFRIPIKDAAAIEDTIGEPDWAQLNYVRMWFESPDSSKFRIYIASADLVQSNWEDTLAYGDDPGGETQFNVAVINTQENSDIYQPPPGVTGYYDQSRQVTEPEQSLLLKYEDLTAGDTCLAERIFFDAPNYMGYRRLEMFVHGPPESDTNTILYFFRIGQDRQNYYAYQDTVRPGWDANGVNIDFNEITGLKEIYQQGRLKDKISPYDTLAGNYHIVGRPTITRVKYLAIGLVNLDSTQRPTGDVWFDELRLTDVRKDVGVATRLTVSGNVADLFTYSGGLLYRNSYFRGLSSSTRGGSQNNLGSGKSSTSYNFSLNLKLDRFLPRSLNASIPLSLRYSKSTEVPRLRFNTDIVLPEELRESESTVNESKALTISEKFSKKTSNLLYTVLLNNIQTNFSYNRTEGRSPAAPASLGENYRFNGRYTLSIRNVPNLKPFFWTQPVPFIKRLSGSKFFIFPNSWNFNSDFNRTFRLTENSSGVITNTLKRDFHGSMKVTYRISDNLTSNYSMDTRRDLSDPDQVKFSFSPKKFKLGLETNYTQSFSAAYSPTLFGFLTHKFNYSATYRENINVRDSTRTVGAGKSYGVSGSLDLSKLFTGAKPKPRRGLPTPKGEVIKVEGGNFLAGALAPFSKVMAFLTGWVDPFGYDYSEKYNYTYIGLVERAQLKFRFGLSDKINAAVRRNARSTGQSNASSKSTAYSLRSGTRLLGGIKADVSFSRKISEDIVKSVNPRKNISTNFPEIRFAIRPLTTFKTFNPIIKKFAPRTNYSRSKSQSINLQTGIITSEQVTTAQRPLVALTFNLLRGLQINFNTDRSTTETRAYNGIGGGLNKHTRSTSKNTRISSKYSFSLPTGIRLPILGRVRFKSTMSVSVDVSMRKEKSESFPTTGEGTKTLMSDRSDVMITPSVSYSFSSQIRGGLSGRWQDTNDVKQQRKSHVRELRIWVDIRF
ncbi:MAG: cell surface protein SprA, partial [Candidatus Zixiibacteriota bacterium]